VSDNYAVIATGGKQERVHVGLRLKVELLSGNADDAIKFDKVLMLKNGETIKIGSPFLDKAAVEAKIIDHGRHDKICVIKFKRRKKYRRTQGHRQHFTEVEITAIPAA
jgi:large subunit ribosomal protein L21